ncbi:MAG: efflux RND transporter periplasmic adaptor subunit [Treponema sp.]|nr:efflux RND transporter periplasmic adaptor subunit [Candidatus Treponema merdequi]
MKKIYIIILSVILLSITTILLINSRIHISKNDITEEISVKTCHPEFENIYSDIESFGTVIYKTKTDVTNLVPGNVISKNVKEGDYVYKNDILYKLKNTELEIEYIQNQNRLNSSKANLELFEARLYEKEKEAKSQLIKISNLKDQIKITEKNISLAHENLENKKALHQLGGITTQEIKESQNQFDSLQTELEIQKRELNITEMGFSKQDLISSGIIPSDDEQLFYNQLIELNTKTSRADLTVAQAEYENSKVSLELTEKLLEDLIIRAPVNGVIGNVNFENGEYIKQNENVLTIMDISTCVAALNIQEGNIYNISVGNRVKLEIPAAQKTIETFITDISPVADTATGNFFVKADFCNKEHLIKPGMFLKCSIANNFHTKYLKIPETALINTTEKNANCFIVKNKMAFMQKVKIAFIRNGFAFINSGLTDEYQIINNPPKNIKDGTYVKVL